MGTKISALGKFRLFGGDASKQRAEEFARTYGYEVRELGTDIPFSVFGLDPWGYAEDRTRYDFAAINEH